MAMATDDGAAYVHAVAGIVDALVAAYEAQQPVNMTRLKNDVAKRYRLPSMPKVGGPPSACPSLVNDALVSDRD
jgi:elongator complex protein 3